MTTTRYRPHAQVLAIPVSVAWAVVFLLISVTFIQYWIRLNVVLLNRVPSIDLMLNVTLVGAVIIGIVAFYTFVDWWERKIETTFRRWSWENGL